MSILLGLSLGAKLLGLGGGTGLLGFGARLLGWDRKAIGLAKRVPPKVWYALAIVAALIAAYFLHQHHVHKIIAAAKLEQKQADEKAFAARARACRRSGERHPGEGRAGRGRDLEKRKDPA
jgi:hypothetical protein